MTDILRGQWGFNGFVVTDYTGISEMIDHGIGDLQTVSARAINAGVDMDMVSEGFVGTLKKSVQEGKVSMETLNTACRRILEAKYKLGLFDNPYVKDTKASDNIGGIKRNIDFVKQVQQQSIVLLKNENNILPLKKESLKRVLVTGPLADESNFMESRYGPNRLDKITVLDGLRSYLNGEVELVYSKGCEIVDEEWPLTEIIPSDMNSEEKKMMNDAVSAAKDVDVVIAVMGEDEFRTGESRSRSSLALPGRQQQLLEALHFTGKPIVLVLINGQPLTINWADKYIPSILETWFPTCIGGEIIAETLFGEYNPGGKLTVTFPRTTGQLQLNFPFKPGSHGGQPKWGPNGSGKTRVMGELYPFGFGLSYTTFAYSNLRIRTSDNSRKGYYNVSVDVTNTGEYDGDEVVQLYIRDKVGSVIPYDSLLKGFERVSLRKGETKTLEFNLYPEDFQLLDRNMEWTLESGDFEIMIGASSQDIRLKQTVTII